MYFFVLAKTFFCRFHTKKTVSRIRKKTFYLQFCMGTPEGYQKSIFNTLKVKKKNKVCNLNPKTQKHKKA
jgi:hypothetical protein